jgi:hypothetical protein
MTFCAHTASHVERHGILGNEGRGCIAWVPHGAHVVAFTLRTPTDTHVAKNGTADGRTINNVRSPTGDDVEASSFPGFSLSSLMGHQTTDGKKVSLVNQQPPHTQRKVVV